MLHIGTTGTETPFLAESELPVTDRLAFSDGEGEQMVQDKQLEEMEDRELAEAMARSSQPPATSSLRTGSSSSSTSVTSSIPEASIQRIVDLGFSRDQAVLELQRTNGNVDAAATALVARSFANLRPPPRR